MNDTPLPKPAPPLGSPKPPTSPIPNNQAEDAAAPVSTLQMKSPVAGLPPQQTPTTVNVTPTQAPPKPFEPTKTAVVKPPASLSALSSMASNNIPPKQPSSGAPQTSGPSPAAPPSPTYAKPKPSFLKFLPFIIGGLVLILIAVFVGMRFLGDRASVSDTNTATNPTNRQTAPVTQMSLEYWGLWEPNEVLTAVIQDFEKQNPGVTVRYTKQSHRDYRERLQTAIASGNGPDVFRFHASWTPMLSQELASLPTSIMSVAEFEKTFYPVATKQLQNKGQLKGIPLMYDGLALYYNKDIFKTANVQPPRTWPELKTLAGQLTVRSGETIQRGGLAIGNTTNVEHFADILAILMLQNGADLTSPNSPEGRDALIFYTNFIKSDKVWSETLPSSTVAFARGDVAMMFAPSWRAHEIKATNPQLSFGIAPMPQLTNEKITLASYWAEGVNAKSTETDMAWKFLKYLNSPDVLKKMYASASQVRSFGELYPRTDLAADLQSNEFAAPYLADAPTAQATFLNSYTHDNGLNDLMIKYYEDAINAVLGGKSAEEVLVTVDQGTKQTLRQYGVTTGN